MTAKALFGVVAAGLGVVVACALGGAVLVGGVAAVRTTEPAAISSAATPSAGWGQVDEFDAEQLANATTIGLVGAQRGVPARGWVVAVATALQESNLRNLPGGDRDSVGLFQQRPSQGRGTPQQLQDSVYAATMFYQRLLAIPGWQTMSLTQPAQAVQHSAVCLGACPPGRSPSPYPSGTGGRCDGVAVLARAATWLTAWNGGPVPYLSSRDPATWLGGYRRDCSGYASMALGLPGPGLTSTGLAARATPIQKADLQVGDLVINPAPDLAGHVVIFDHWTDATMSSYQRAMSSPVMGHPPPAIPHPYFGNYAMSAYRWSSFSSAVLQ
jgi:hypothetical protein